MTNFSNIKFYFKVLFVSSMSFLTIFKRKFIACQANVKLCFSLWLNILIIIDLKELY